MSVRKEIKIKINDHKEVVLLTGVHSGDDSFTLQIRHADLLVGICMGSDATKALIESLEDIYYKFPLENNISSDNPQPDYVQEIETLKRTRDNAYKSYSDEVQKNNDLRFELNEKQAQIGSLTANLKAETENVKSLRNTIQELRSNNSSGPDQVTNLKEMNEVLIAENDVLRKKVMELKRCKKYVKKVKHKIEHLKDIELLAVETESHLKEVREILKSTKLERDGLEATCSVYQNELNQLKNSGRVYIGGETIHSYGLALVAEERLSHFKKGIKIENDVLKNNGIELAHCAKYCLTLNPHHYPCNWDKKFKEKVDISNTQERLKFAAALIIAQLDKDNYVKTYNAEHERKKAGQ